MKNLKLLLLGAAGILLTVNDAQSQVTWNATVNTGVWSSAIGLSTSSTNAQSFSGGAYTTASGTQSFAFGYRSSATAAQSFAAGYGNLSDGRYAFSFGSFAYARNDYAMAFGLYLRANAARSMLIGTGAGNTVATLFNNNIDNSLMIGFNSNIPSLFVGPSSGAGTTGRVGIGTTNTPTTIGGVNISAYRLFVKGGILTEEVRVRTGWADYVFDDNYQLPTLYEVSDFIEENGHLPNVPSAEQVEEEGLELGDITRIQQEKIEELTLYLIEMQKEIDALKARLDASEE